MSVQFSQHLNDVSKIAWHESNIVIDLCIDDSEEEHSHHEPRNLRHVKEEPESQVPKDLGMTRGTQTKKLQTREMGTQTETDESEEAEPVPPSSSSRDPKKVDADISKRESDCKDSSININKIEPKRASWTADVSKRRRYSACMSDCEMEEMIELGLIEE